MQARFYEQPGTKLCAAFLVNNDTKQDQNIKFRGREFYLPPRSISILPDCKTVVYNTMTVFVNHLFAFQFPWIELKMKRLSLGYAIRLWHNTIQGILKNPKRQTRN